MGNNYLIDAFAAPLDGFICGNLQLAFKQLSIVAIDKVALIVFVLDIRRREFA